MRFSRLAIAMLLAGCAPVHGNTGVFFGSGHTLRLVKSADVQMVSEDVTIAPICGVCAMAHQVDVRCVFVLKNLSAKPVKIQVGFPLDRGQYGPPPPPSDGTNEVLWYHFIARDGKSTYHARYVPAEPQGKYAHIFLWDMEFAAAETKTLHVSYVLPMSFAAGTTRRMGPTETAVFPPKHEKPWHVRTEACIVLSFSYITETGRSWVGPIEKAVFRFRNTTFEHCLQKVPEYVGGNPADLPPDAKIPDDPAAEVGSMADLGFVFGMKLDTVYPLILPAGGKPSYTQKIPVGGPKPQYEPDCIVWEYDNYKPGPPLGFTYYLMGFPTTPAVCEPWVKQVLGKTPAKADVLELREIMAAFHGVAPQAASVKRLAEQQVWFDPQRHVREADLSAPQRAVLARLQAIADETPSVALTPVPPARVKPRP